MKETTDFIRSGSTGLPIMGAKVTVFVVGTTAKATLYATNNIAGPTLANPLTTDRYGSYSFYVADGRYDIVGTSPTGETFTDDDVAIYDLDALKVSIVAVSDAAGVINDVAPSIPAVAANESNITAVATDLKLNALSKVKAVGVDMLLGATSRIAAVGADLLSGSSKIVTAATDLLLGAGSKITIAANDLQLGATSKIVSVGADLQSGASKVVAAGTDLLLGAASNIRLVATDLALGVNSFILRAPQAATDTSNALAAALANPAFGIRAVSISSGLASSVNGQTVVVTQAMGLADEIYTRSAEGLLLKSITPVGDGISIVDRLSLLGAPLATAQNPIVPIVDLDPLDAKLADGRYIPSKATPTVTHNLYGGPERLGPTSATLTMFAGVDNGIAYHRLQINNGGFVQIGAPPKIGAATRIKLAVKSNAGAGAQTIKGVVSPAGALAALPAIALTEGAWTNVDQTGTIATGGFLILYNNSGAAQDILLRDDVQIYIDGEVPPAIEPTRRGSARRSGSAPLPASVPLTTGNTVAAPFYGQIDLRNAAGLGVTLAEGTAICAFSQTSVGGANAGVLIAGTTAPEFNNLALGALGGNLLIYGPGVPYRNSEGGTDNLKVITGKGFIIAAVRWSPTTATQWIDGAMRTLRGPGGVAITLNRMLYGGGGFNNVEPFNGFVGSPLVFDKALSDIELLAAMQRVRAKLTIGGDTYPSRIFHIALGDSITQGNIGGTRSYATSTMDLLNIGPWGLNRGGSGSVVGLPAVLPNTPAGGSLFWLLDEVVRSIINARALGHKVVVSMHYGHNGIPDAAAYQQAMDAVRAAGAKLAVGTPLPGIGTNGGSGAPWVNFCTALRSPAYSSHYDALFDFAADSVMGNPATCNDTAFYIDKIHPTQNGIDTRLVPIFLPVIASLIASL